MTNSGQGGKENGGGFVSSLPEYPACNVLAYFFVVYILLQKLGVTKIDERIHFILF